MPLMIWGVKKLPKVKELQAEYARLLEEKKKTYAGVSALTVRRCGSCWTAKANVDRLMSMEQEKREDKGKVHEQNR